MELTPLNQLLYKHKHIILSSEYFVDESLNVYRKLKKDGKLKQLTCYKTTGTTSYYNFRAVDKPVAISTSTLHKLLNKN